MYLTIIQMCLFLRYDKMYEYCLDVGTRDSYFSFQMFRMFLPQGVGTVVDGLYVQIRLVR